MGFREEFQRSWARFGGFLVVLILAGTANVNGQDCSSDTFNFDLTTIVIYNISAKHVNMPIARYAVEHVSGVTVSELQGYGLYITAELNAEDPNELIISTNEAFKDFLQIETIPQLESQLYFTCTSGSRSIRIRVTIKDENLFPPTFSKAEYTIQLPLPLPKNFDLTQYVDEGKGIIAYDNDLIGNEVSFKIDDNPYFLVEQEPGASKKQFIARIRTKETLTRLEENLSVTIIGTDAGDPPKTGSAVLKISGDPLIPYIEPPQFVDPLYRIIYNRLETFSPIEVNLVAGTYDSSSRFILSGENSDMFTITEKGDRSGASVTLRTGVTIPETMNFLSVVVTASRTGSELDGRTAIVVDVEQEVKVQPAFEQSIYAGTVDQDRVISLETDVKLIGSTVLEGADVSLGGEDAEFFTFLDNGGTITFNATDNLTAEVLQKKFYFHFTVQATKADVGSAIAFVVLEVLKQDVILPKFEQPFYEGSLTEEGIAEIPEVKITENTYVDNIKFNSMGDTDLFSINIAGNKITLVPKGITEENLSGKLYLLVRISASQEQEVQAETIVIIKIIRQEIITPQFENNFLQSQLVEENLQFTPVKVVVNLTTWTTATEVFLKDSRNIFDLTPTTIQNEYSINLRSGVEIPRDSHLTVLVEANNPKSSAAACFVLIEVIRVPLVSPEFEQTVYEGTIDSSGSLQELKLKLKPETYDDSIAFSLVDQDSDLFQLQKLETNELLITFNESTTMDDLANRSNLRFNVRAVKSGSPEVLVPVVIFIEKAEVRVPRFVKPLYRSFIGPELVLERFETIQLVEETAAQGLELEILQNNTDLFMVQMVQGNRITIELNKNLTSDDLEGLDRLEFVIEVTNPGAGSGFATIVVDIVREPVVVPEFTEVSYSGTLQEGFQVMTFTEEITLKPGSITNDVQYVVVGEDSALVKLSINEDLSLSFSLLEEITVEQLKLKSQINFIVQAYNPGSVATSASIVVRIVRPVQVAFRKSSFNGVLTEGQTLVDFQSDQIQFMEGTLLAGVSFELSEGESNLFLVLMTAENVVQLSLNPSVIWNQIRFNYYLSFKLSATNPGSDPATTTIIVNIVNNPVPTPVFTKTFYRGSLQKGIREVSFSAPEVITLQADTVTTTLAYQVTENDADLFDVVREDNKFKVSLNEALDEQIIEGRDLLSFRIEANNQFGATDSATIIVSIQLEEIIAPVFVDVIYRGSIKEQSSDLSFSTEMRFLSGTANGNTEVGLTAGDADWFSATHDNSKVIITVKDSNSIKWDEITDRSFLSFALQAVNPGSSSASAFVILDIQRTAVITPKFKSLSFQGSLKEGSREVDFSEGAAIELQEGSLIPGHQLSLSGSDFELFEHELEGLQVKITLKDSVTKDDLDDRTYLRFNVAVTNPGSETATANVLVDLERETAPLNGPLFEKFFYNGSIGQDLILSLDEPIAIKQETYSADVQYEIVETNNDLLQVVKQGREVLVQLARPITIDDLQGPQSLHITIKAFNELSAESVCFLVISLPEESQEPCASPAPPSVDCTDCYDCTSGGPLDDVPVFAYGNYRFFFKSDNTGLIGTVKATVKDPSTILEHRADFTDAYLRSRVSFSLEGILRVEQPLLPGQYTFKVTALNSQSQKQSSVNVLLDITQDQECPANPEAPKITTVEKLLLIESLQEESPHQNIFPSQLGSCEYELIDEKPYLGFSYFEIDSETHWLTSRSFDRENTTLFDGMIIPQFQLRLHLVCPTDPNLPRLIKRSLIETGDLNYARDVTVINVIVVDINDNNPQFVEPPTSNDAFHIGFPVSSIAAGLMLPHLITVRAEDADEGLNAEIRFSLSSNTHFGIESETGMIYPLKDAMKTDTVTTIVVTATDRDGASDGRSSLVQLRVHRLEEDHLVMMTILGQVDAENLIQQINANTRGVQVKVLTQARVPELTSDSKSLRQSSSEGSILRMIVYAFNGQNEVQSSETITSIIQSSSVSTIVTAESYTNVACLNNPECSGYQSSDEANVGLIVATSILGVLFLISTGLAIFLYVRFVRPLNREPANPSDVVQLENDFEISPPPSPPMLAGGKLKATESPEMDERKTSIQILGITDQESEDSSIPTAQLAHSLDDRLERVDEYGTISSRDTIEDSSSLSMNEPRNVKFNEMVERIEVVEHHPEDHRKHRVDFGDDDSVYSERM
ncbi:uncharacterized protein LOC135700309 [Ochlerotatus camptorhynchus]|uniref:uncharacterized protein LOC135700309 n=1 Tax=Ochlerotatus camptorhynchus TaxID=644619 RepID=UPI0031D23475